MSVILAGGLRLPSGIEGAALRADLLAGRRSPAVNQRVIRPDRVSSGAWRRMSALSREVVSLSAPLVEAWSPQAIVWGSAIGEIGPTTRFLDTLFERGGALASPLAFQTSVYNAPIGHLAIATGFTGRMETLSAGGATGLQALFRGQELLHESKIERVLVVAADPVTPVTRDAFSLNGLAKPGACVAALVLGRAGDGPTLVLNDGPASGASPLFMRRSPLLNESVPRVGAGAFTIEAALGLCPSAGLAATFAASFGGGRVIDWDQSRLLSASVF